MALCFRDMTFCASDCTNTTCFRHYGDEVKEAAKKWWGGIEGDPPIAFSDFSDTCRGYIRKGETTARQALAKTEVET